MNWQKIIQKMNEEETNFVELTWSDDDWAAWTSGDLTDDQEDMIAAAEAAGLTPMPGALSPDTVSFS